MRGEGGGRRGGVRGCGRDDGGPGKDGGATGRTGGRGVRGEGGGGGEGGVRGCGRDEGGTWQRWWSY